MTVVGVRSWDTVVLPDYMDAYTVAIASLEIALEVVVF